VLPLCTPAPVVGGDAGSRDSISIQSTDAVQTGMFALCSAGVVGRIDRVGMTGGAQVRLITDPGFAVTGCFGRFAPNEKGEPAFNSLNTPPPLVQGAGRGAMVIRRMDFDSIKDVKVGDWLIVKDLEWPQNLQGYRLGRVTSIDRSTSSPLFAEIQVRPVTNLMQLREVMVMNRTAPAVKSARTEP
jgi:cell shape-determining protein MreC